AREHRGELRDARRQRGVEERDVVALLTERRGDEQCGERRVGLHPLELLRILSDKERIGEEDHTPTDGDDTSILPAWYEFHPRSGPREREGHRREPGRRCRDRVRCRGYPGRERDHRVSGWTGRGRHRRQRAPAR